jgi:hypothetical protein
MTVDSVIGTAVNPAFRQMANNGPSADCQVPGSEPQIAAAPHGATPMTAVDQLMTFYTGRLNVG